MQLYCIFSVNVFSFVKGGLIQSCYKLKKIMWLIFWWLSLYIRPLLSGILWTWSGLQLKIHCLCEVEIRADRRRSWPASKQQTWVCSCVGRINCKYISSRCPRSILFIRTMYLSRPFRLPLTIIWSNTLFLSLMSLDNAFTQTSLNGICSIPDNNHPTQISNLVVSKLRFIPLLDLVKLYSPPTNTRATVY